MVGPWPRDPRSSLMVVGWSHSPLCTRCQGAIVVAEAEPEADALLGVVGTEAVAPTRLRPTTAPRNYWR